MNTKLDNISSAKQSIACLFDLNAAIPVDIDVNAGNNLIDANPNEPSTGIIFEKLLSIEYIKCVNRTIYDINKTSKIGRLEPEIVLALYW